MPYFASTILKSRKRKKKEKNVSQSSHTYLVLPVSKEVMKLDGSNGGVSFKVRENVSKVRHFGYFSELKTTVVLEQRCKAGMQKWKITT